MAQIFIVFLCIFCLFGCTGKDRQNSFQVEKIQTSQNTQENPYVHIGDEKVSLNGLYSLRIPTSFVSDDTDPDFDFFYTDTDGGIGIFSLNIDKNESQAKTLPDAMDMVMSDFESMDMSSLEGMIKNIHRYTVTDRKYSGKFEGEEAIFYVRGIEFNTHYVIIVAMTLPHLFENNIGLMFDIIDSLEWKK